MDRTAVSLIDDGEGVAASPGRVIALVAVLTMSALVAVLPVLVALGIWTDTPLPAVGVASLVAAFGGVKLAAAAWGVAASIE